MICSLIALIADQEPYSGTDVTDYGSCLEISKTQPKSTIAR